MTVVGQHPGYELPRQATASSSTWFRIALVLIAVALVAGVGYLAYEAATEETAPQPIEESRSVETVQAQIDAAVLGLAGPSSVEMVNTEIAGALMGIEAGPSSFDIVQAEIVAARADMLGSSNSVEMVQAEIDRQLEQKRLTEIEEAMFQLLHG